MGFRIQPREIEVPEDDPFRNDQLSRRDSADALTHIIGSIAGPCVLAVDAGWGNGKTTFVNMWSRHLRNEGFLVAHFNAWTTDYCGDPFIALSTELTDSLPSTPNEELTSKIAEFTKAAQKVALAVMSETIRRATVDLVDLSPVFAALSSDDTSRPTKTRISAYRESARALDEFKGCLRDLATALSPSHTKQPVVIVIDELDRCRPAYAVEFLEVAKHLFDVDNVVFVISVNRKQLAHSIKAIYGADFDALGYLNRFFDVDFRLPNADRDSLVDDMLSTIDMDSFLSRNNDNVDIGDSELAKYMLRAFFSSEHLSIRDVEQTIRRLGLVLGSIRRDHRSYVIPATVAVVLRAVDFDIYNKFIDGQIEDEQVVDGTFDKTSMHHLKSVAEDLSVEYAKGLILFEAAVIAAGYEIEGTGKPHVSRLLNKYTQETKGEVKYGDRRVERARAIIQYTARYRGIYGGFKESVRRIELISESFRVVGTE